MDPHDHDDHDASQAVDGLDDHEPGRTRSGAPGAEGSTVSRGECQEALDTLYHYLDGELSDERRVLISTHLQRCSSCLETYDFEAELKVVVARRCRESVPPSLLARVAAAIREASGSGPGSGARATR